MAHGIGSRTGSHGRLADLLRLRGQGRPQAAARPRMAGPVVPGMAGRDINAAVNVATAAGLAVTAWEAQPKVFG